MMKPTGLLVAVGVLAALSGTAWWFNKHPAKDTRLLPDAPKILTLSEDQIEGVRIAKPGADPVVLKKLGATWVVAEPKAMPADQDTVKSLVTSLATLTSMRLIDEHPASLADFGLDKPAADYQLTLKGGAVTDLALGGDTVSGGDTYARVTSKSSVYTISSFVKQSIDKSLTDLRDKRLLRFDPDKLTSVAVTTKGPAFEFGRNGQGEWQITRPVPMRADSLQVDDFIRKLKDAKMDLAVSSDTAAGAEKKTSAAFSAGAKIGVIAVTDNSGTHTLEVRQDKDNTYYAKSDAAGGTYKLSGDLGDGLKDKTADAFRNKKLFDFGFSDPTRIEIDAATYQKAGDRWKGAAGEFDAPSLQNVIDKLRDLSAAGFSDKPAGTRALSLAVTSGDNHKLEKVTVTRAGESYRAQREGDPAVYVIDSKTFEQLQKAVSEIKPYQAPKSEKKK